MRFYIKMKIITAVVNNPEFIEIQYHTLKRFYQGDYEFIVFNDAKVFPDYTNSGDVTLRQQIEDKCNALQIKCISIPNDHHRHQDNASERCADSMNVMFQYQMNNPDQYLVIDSDMFLIDKWSADKLKECDVAIVLQSRTNPTYHYPWNGLYYFDMSKLKNTELVHWERVPGYCDVGGKMHDWLHIQMEGRTMPNTDEIRWSDKKFHTDNIYFIKHLWSCTWDKSEAPDYIKENQTLLDFLTNDPRNANGKFFCELYDGAFLHYRAGGNWRQEGLAFHQAITQKLKQALET
jgi:hypothetical protein